jgi:DNA modification methylase
MNTVKVRCEGALRLPLADMTPLQGNLKDLTKENFAKLKASFLKHGFTFPFFVWQSGGKNYILDGHQRDRVLRELAKDKGVTLPDTYPAVPIHARDRREAAELLLKATSQYGTITDEGLYEFLNAEGIPIQDIKDELVFDGLDMDDFADGYAPEGAGGLTDPDAVPEPPKVAISKPGDLWVLGEHRLLCGSASDLSDVERLMNGEKAVLLATDPPYGVSFQGAKYNPRAKDWDAIQNDDRRAGDLQEWLTKIWLLWIPQFVDERFAFYCWTAAKSEYVASLAAAAAAAVHVQSQIIWVKNVFALGQADYQWAHENCLYGFLQGKKHFWYGGRAQRSTWMIKIIPTCDYQHPTQKPTELFEIPMKNHSKPGEVCAEPFAGSGSQFIAAEQLDRRCYGMEIEPKYCDVIVQRWEQFTGKKARLEKAKVPA